MLQARSTFLDDTVWRAFSSCFSINLFPSRITPGRSIIYKASIGYPQSPPCTAILSIAFFTCRDGSRHYQPQTFYLPTFPSWTLMHLGTSPSSSLTEEEGLTCQTEHGAAEVLLRRGVGLITTYIRLHAHYDSAPHLRMRTDNPRTHSLSAADVWVICRLSRVSVRQVIDSGWLKRDSSDVRLSIITLSSYCRETMS